MCIRDRRSADLFASLAAHWAVAAAPLALMCALYAVSCALLASSMAEFTWPSSRSMWRCCAAV
eukprot:8580997-Alexandrium_andersonii.AAC.1